MLLNSLKFHQAVHTLPPRQFLKALVHISSRINGRDLEREFHAILPVTETSTTMEIQSDISEYIPYIKIMFPEYEAYLDMLDGATVKLILDKKG